MNDDGLEPTENGWISSDTCGPSVAGGRNGQAGPLLRIVGGTVASDAEAAGCGPAADGSSVHNADVATAAAEALQLATALAVHPDYRVLRRLDLATGNTGLGTRDAPFIGVAIDVETTGIDHARDVVIELALRRFRYNRDGLIVAIDRSYSWLEDPGRPVSIEIARLTGLTDSDLEGQSIDDDAVVRLLRSADVVVAHNASFDRKFVERRLPGAAGLAWACSCSEIDWRAHGFDGRALGWLLGQTGWFHGGHRAAADVDAVISLLRHRLGDGRTALAVMMERVNRDSWIVRARGAAFEVKDLLRMRGFRWDAERKLWWREVADADRMQEEFWLAGHIYGPHANARAVGPDFVRVTRFERHG